MSGKSCRVIFAGIAGCLLALNAGAQEAVSSPAAPVITVQGNQSSNAIIKWCGPDGSIRYSNTDLKAEGFTPCGQPETISRCSTSGHRYIGKAVGAPSNTIDCGVWRQAVAQGKKAIAARSRGGDGAGGQETDAGALVQQLVSILQSQQQAGEAQSPANAEALAQQLLQFLQRPPQQPPQRTSRVQQAPDTQQGDMLQTLMQLLQQQQQPAQPQQAASDGRSWKAHRAWAPRKTYTKQQQSAGGSPLEQLMKLLQQQGGSGAGLDLGSLLKTLEGGGSLNKD